MGDIEVSVVLPCYNGENYIQQAVRSFAQNEYEDAELIIIDDGSTDSSAEIARQCCNLYNNCRIRLFKIDNQGVSHARNYGIQRAMGRYILFLDCDDYYSPNFINSLIVGFKKHNADFSFCYWKNDKSKDCMDESGEVDKEDIAKMILYHNKNLHLCSIMYDIEIIKKYDITFRENLKFGEDLDFIWKYFVRCSKFYYTSNCFYFHTENPSSVMHSFSYSKIDAIQMFDDIAELISLYYKDFFDRYEKYAVQRSVIAIQKELAIHGEKKLFVKIYKKYKERSYLNLLLHDNIKNRLAAMIYIISPRLFYSVLHRLGKYFK